MPTVLCIDTSSAYCSLALAQDDVVHVRQERLERSHSQHLLPLLDDLFGDAELAPSALDCVGLAAGPGSFTGVRLGASACQAIALAAGAQVVTLLSSQVLALSASANLKPDEVALVAIRSRGEAYYLSLWQRLEHEVCCLHADELLDAPAPWLANATVSLVLGAQPPWLALKAPMLEVAPDARAMLQPVNAAFIAGEAKAPEAALPIYIDGDSPWRKQSAG